MAPTHRVETVLNVWLVRVRCHVLFVVQKTRAKQRFSKMEAEEKRRKEEFTKLERVWQGGKEVYRRNNMEEAKRAKHVVRGSFTISLLFTMAPSTHHPCAVYPP